MNAFSGAVAVVTGAGSGIGRSICAHLGRHGAVVTAVDRDLDAAHQTESLVMAEGGQARAVAADVSREEEISAVVEAVTARHGRIDYLFNNAGVSVNGEFQDVPQELWRQVIDINLWGVIHGCRAAYPVMVKQKAGHIINTASLAGLIPGGLTTPYSASKHAVVGLSLTLRGEAKQYGVKVTALCPGYLRTNIQRTTPTVSAYLTSVSSRAREQKASSKTPEDCIDQMMRGVARNRAVVISPRLHKVYWWLYRVAPGLPPYAWDRIIRSLKRKAEASS